MSEHKTNSHVFHHAFRTKYPGIVPVLVSDISIGIPTASGFGGPSTFKQFKGIWDTGATNSVITTNIVKDLNLSPCGKVWVSGVNSKELANQYLVDIGFVMGVYFPNWLVTESNLNSPGIDILIGMDIIQHGDFLIGNGKGSSILSFTTPSIPNLVDLYEKATQINPKDRK